MLFHCAKPFRSINFTCSQITRKSSFLYSYVSPSSGLNGLPKRSQFEANADTAKPTSRARQKRKIDNRVDEKKNSIIQIAPATYFIRSTGSSCSDARRNRRAYSIYSVMRCKKLSGSLNTIGIVILLSSFPIQFFNTDQMLTSFLLDIGDGKAVL